MKKFLAFVISFALILALLPATALAEGYYWTFEDTAAGSLPAGFTTAVLDAGTYNPAISTLFPGGTAAAVSTSGGSFGNSIFMGSWFTNPSIQANRWLITPALDISDQTDVLRWSAKSMDPYFLDSYNVLVSTTDNQPASFTTTLTSVVSESRSFQRHEIDLSDYSGQTVYIAFQLVSQDMYLLLLDNIGLIASIGSDMLMVNAGIDQSIDFGSSATLNASVSGGEAPYSYSWSDGTTTVGNTQSIAVTPDISTTYTCMVTDATGTTIADSVDVSVLPVYTITATPASCDFGSIVQGYTTAPAEQTFTIKNTGSQSVMLSAAPNTCYDISSFSSSTLAKNETATFTIRPKTGLSAGTYNEAVTVSTDHGTSVDISVSFTVEALLTLSPSVSSGTVYTGGRITLTPTISGGTWTFDSDYLTRSNNTFTAVKVGQTTVGYDAAGQHTSYVVTIRESELPETGQDFTWAYLLAGCAALLALSTAAFRLRKQPTR